MYSENILKYFNSDEHIGQLTDANVHSYVERAGSIIALDAKIVSEKIIALKYRVLGPTVLIALCGYLAEILTQKNIAEAKLLTSQQMIDIFSLSQKDLSYALMAEDALKKLWENNHA